MATLPVHITGTANVGPANGGEVKSVMLTAGSDAATLTLKENGASGAAILILKAPTNDTRQVRFKSLAYAGQLHATLAGTGPVATIEV
jgi:hypothetical protein